MQFNKIEDDKWIGIDDHTAFEMPDEYIHFLFGYNEGEQHGLKEYLHREWMATHLYYKRKDYDINNNEEEEEIED